MASVCGGFDVLQIFLFDEFVSSSPFPNWWNFNSAYNSVHVRSCNTVAPFFSSFALLFLALKPHPKIYWSAISARRAASSHQVTCHSI
jgi:hypothetical protein